MTHLGWIVSGLLYVLGAALAYQALRDVSELSPRDLACCVVMWPALVVFGLASDLYASAVGDRLWRRRHAKWCAEVRNDV